MKNGSDRGKNIQERELKKNNVQKHMRIKQKEEILKKTNVQRLINMKNVQ